MSVIDPRATHRIQSPAGEREPPLVVFAYGSLLFRPGFAYAERQPAIVDGFARSFRQTSPDHRGTPDQPGRVVTLVAREGARCAGALYWIDSPHTELLRELDHRERAGYERVTIDARAGAQRFSAVTWIARPGNPHDAGELELEALARQILNAKGPSGRNDEYVFLLEQALAELGGRDPLVSELASLLRR